MSVLVKDSILLSTKKNLGISEGMTAFDSDITMHINSVLSTLTQLGIGPLAGLNIEDEMDTWDDFFGGDPRLNAVKTYVTLRVRMIFDPPNTSYTQNAISEQIKELEWRLEVARTPVIPEAPINPPTPGGPVNPPGDWIIDGGDLDPEED